MNLFDSIPLVRIWDYHHNLFWVLITSFAFIPAAYLLSKTFAFNFVAIILLTISTFLYLNVFLKIPKVIGVIRGLFTYIFIIYVFISCFSNIYIEHGIINNGVVTHEYKDTIYFSIVTWTTLGYGDFQPTESARIWAATEAFMGYIYMGLLVGLIISGLTPKSTSKVK